MAEELDLAPLDKLFQTIYPPTDSEDDHPLLALARLQRKPPSKRNGADNALGEIEWAIAVGGAGKEKEGGEGASGSRKRKGAKAPPDEWWTTRMCAEEVKELMQQVEGSALTPETMVGRVKAKWTEGKMGVQGYKGPGAEPRSGIELIINITESLPLTIILSPVDDAPISLLTILAHVIPPFLSCTVDREACQSATKERDALRLRCEKLERQLQERKEQDERARKRARAGAVDPPQRQNSGGADFGKRVSSQEGGGYSQASQGYGGLSQSQGSVSPQKKVVPGQTQRGVLRPGDPGYAGNAHRPGRVAVDTGFEDPSDDSSDSD
ncbi:hypothetical protein JCM8097_004776 [Rhodosporidiobolus ruineniae]